MVRKGPLTVEAKEEQELLARNSVEVGLNGWGNSMARLNRSGQRRELFQFARVRTTDSKI
jgi:hypothetical protein